MFYVDLQNIIFFLGSFLTSIKISQGEVFSAMTAEIEENKKDFFDKELQQDAHNDVVIAFEKKQHDISLKWAIEQQKKDQQSFDGLLHFLPNLCEELNGLIQQHQEHPVDQPVDDQNQVDEDEQFVEIPENFHFLNDFQNDNHQVEELNQDEQDEQDDNEDFNDENDEVEPNFINEDFDEQEEDAIANDEFEQILALIQEIWRMLLVQQCVMLPIRQRSEIIHLLRLPVINKELILSRLNSMVQEQDFQEPILIEHFKTLHHSQELLQKTADLITQFIEM